MAEPGIRALTFDTGGTILDWHTGFRDAFAAAGQRHGVDRDWAICANDFRRRTLEVMLNLGEHGPPEHNFDDAHRFCLDELLAAESLDMFDADDRREIAWTAPHNLTCWPDFPPVLPMLRDRFIVVSFSLLSYRLIIDTARRNGLSWDAVLSCEGLGLYKLLPGSYRRAAEMLQLQPEECCMVACHPFDLDAAQNVGFRTALVRRPYEWGRQAEDVPEQSSGEKYDIAVDEFPNLAEALGRLK